MIPGILLTEEIQAPLLHPVLPRRVVDFVGCREDPIVRIEHDERREFVGHPVRADLGRVWAVLRVVELELVVLHDHGSAVPHVLEQPAVVRAQVFPPFVCTHARHDGIEAGEISPRQIVGRQHLDLRPELRDRGRHLIADAHDVADRQVGRYSHVDHLHRRSRRIVDVIAPDMRILDHLIAAGVRLAAGRRDGAHPELGSLRVRRRLHHKPQRLRLVLACKRH